MWRPLMEEVQSYREAAGKREMALEEEQINSSATAILGEKKRTGRWLKMMYSNSLGTGENWQVMEGRDKCNSQCSRTHQPR